MFDTKNDIDWEEATVKRWMSSISKEGTRRSYKTAFRNYSKFTGLNASQMIDEAITDSRLDERLKQDIVKQRLLAFYSYLEKEKKSIWYCNTSVQSIRSFYSTFNIFVILKKKSRLPRPHAENRRIRITPQLLRQYLDSTKSLRDRSILLVLYQSGLDCSSLCSLTYGDISKGLELDESPMRIPSDENRLLQRPKSSVQFYTFIGRDALESLKIYIKEVQSKGFKFSDSTPLFLKEGSSLNSFEGITTDIVQDLLRSLAVRMGYLKNERDKGRNPISSHSFRESFSSILTNANVNDSVVDFWLGHEIGSMGEAYKKKDLESLTKIYAEVEPKLSLSNNGNGNHKKIQELEETISQLSKEDLSHKTALEIMTKKAMELEEKSMELEAEVQRLKGSQNMMKDEFGYMGDRLVTLEKMLKVKPPKTKVMLT